VFVGPRDVGVELDADVAGVTGSPQSKTQIENFRCTSTGTPFTAVDISCNVAEFGQTYSPDNEIAVAVNPLDPNLPWRLHRSRRRIRWERPRRLDRAQPPDDVAAD
jgi:hypothetical protein